MDVPSLIDQILERCNAERLLPPLKTRLVKLLYLAELEYYRRTRQRLTDLDWKFHHFGPYAPELSEYLGNPDVDALGWSLGNRKSITKDHDVERVVADVVHEWGNAELNALLDYVYFETEPMQNAARGEVLDFSVTRPLSDRQKLKITLDPQRLLELRTKLSARAADYERLRVLPLASEDLFDNLKEWDSERMTKFGQGECYIDPNSLR